MKSPRFTIRIIAALALGALTVGVWLDHSPHEQTASGGPGLPQRTERPANDPVGPAQDGPTFNQTAAETAAGSPDPAAGSEAKPPEFARFNDWSKRYLAAEPADRPALIAEGEALATARRVALSGLISADPRQALENAVPMVVRQTLPAQVVALLEERVSARGFYGVLGVLGAPEGDAPVRREVRIEGRPRYRAFVFGRRERQQTTESIAVSGIAVDRDLALDERPLRVLENGEVPDPAKPVVETCPVSGKSTHVTRAEDALPPITQKTPAVEIAGTIHYLCDGGHIRSVEEGIVAQEGASGGAVKPTTAISSTPSTGVRSLLYMRLAFPESNREPQTETAAYDMMRQVNDWFVENSFGNLYIVTTVAPLIVLPRTEAWYNGGGGDEFDVRSDAQAVARQMGYDTSSYDLDIVVYSGGPGGFGGLGYVGGKGSWLKSINVGVACHELGHNFGVWHANYWNTSGASVIGAGSNLEYGNSYDTMGSASAGDLHFNANFKAQLKWLPEQSFVHNVTTSGMYRIFAFDQARLDPGNRYALKVSKDSDREYWAEFRQRSLSSNKWTKDGILLNWSPWVSSANGTHLLDTTPGSPDDKTDAAVVIGRTFSDFEAGIHITPMGKGGTVPESMDVVVNVGGFPTNGAPDIAVSASASAVATGVAVSFTAAAADPDGDTLSYAWDFGDKNFSNTNSPAVSKSWGSAGDYTVRCVASDMKGGTASQSVVVRVGSPATFRVSGVLTLGGQPLAGVRVHNGLTGAAYRGSHTNSDGSYVISGLAAGSYTFGAALHGHTFAATGFTNPLSVSAGVSGANFTAASSAIVTLGVTDADCAEGTANPGRFTLTRTGSTTGALTVKFLSPTGSAFRGSDYTLAPDLVSASPLHNATIPAGQASLDLVVTATDDTSPEGPERVTLELVAATGYVITGQQTATLFIQDTDTTKAVVSLKVADANAAETGDPASFVVSRNGSTTGALTVVFALSGTAVSGTDYQSIGTQVVIPAGASSAPLTITPINDNAAEGTETATVTLSTNSAYIRAPSSADYTGTINLLDDDIATVTVAAADSAAAEAGSDPGIFLLTRTGSTSQPLTVNYALSGSAHQGVDYAPLPGVLTIPAGSSIGSVTITPIDDGLGEPSQTAVLQLRGGVAYVAGNPALATVTITDNSDPPVVTIGVSDGVAGEPAETGKFKFTTTGSGTGNITVKYIVTGTATPSADYTALSGTLSILRNTTAEITVTPINDAELESYETVTVTIAPDPAYTTHLDMAATINLKDDDQPIVSVTPTNDFFTESSGTGKFWLSRTGATTSALVVNYTLGGTAANGADYSLLSGTVTIPAGSAGVAVNITPINDTLVEGSETIIFDLAAGAYGTAIGRATLYLSDNETPAVQVKFASGSTSGSESSGEVAVLVVLTAASPDPVTVEYVLGGGSSLAGIDYQLAPGVLDFAPGETEKTIPLTIIDDTFIEPGQTIFIKLQNADGAALGTSTHTYTINDNDSAPMPTVGFSATTSSALESIGTAPVFVVLSAAQPGAVTVDFAVTGGTATSGADYGIASGTLTFAAGETAKLLPNTIADNAVIESGETVILTLSNPTGANLNANTAHTLTITDDDTNIVTIAATTPAVLESSTGAGVFTLTRAGSTAAALTVNLIRSGTAANGADYQTLAATAAISAGQASAVIQVKPHDDTLIQGDLSVALALAAGPYTIGAPGSATVTILDDEGLVSVTATQPNTAESSGVSGVFTFSRTGPTSAPLTVRYSTAGTATSGADYLATGTGIVIPAGQSTANLNIKPITDSLSEGSETASLTLTPDAAYLLGSPLTATVTIADSPMDLWRSENFAALASDPATSGDFIDIDGDGLNTLFEYALKGAPHSPDTSPVLGMTPGFLSLTYRRNLAATDLDFVIEEKPTLDDTWHPSAVTEEILFDDGTTRVIKASVSTGLDTSRFLHLKVKRR